MKKAKFTFPLAILAFAFLFSCSSCGGDGAKSAWKHDDNTVRMRVSTAPNSINPYLARTKYERLPSELVFQCPMNFDYGTMAFVPQLIKAAPTVQDITEGEFKGGQSFTYEIMPEATWDDGKPVTGHDYEFTVKALFNPKMPTQRYLGYVEFVRDVKVDEADPKKFTVFAYKKYFLNMEAISNVTILPEHIYDEGGLMKKFAVKDLTDPAKAATLAADPALQQFADAYTSPKFAREVNAGSGPYQVAEWTGDQRLVLAKKKNWWGEKLAGQYPLLAAYPDTVVFLPIADQVAAIAAIKDESVDVAIELDAKQFNDLRKVDFVQKIYNFYTPPTFTYFYTAMQNRNPKLADKRVRRAIAETIDMDMVIKDLYDSLAERQVGPFFPSQKYIDSSLKPIAANEADARKLLEEAGWKDSNGNGTVDKMIDGKLEEMKLQYVYSAGSTFSENFSLLLKNNCQKIGIEIEPVPLDGKVLADKLKNGEFDLAARGAGWQPIPDDPKQFWHTDGAVPGGSNYSRFGNASSDALIDAIQNAPDEASRDKLYKDFQQLMYDEQPVIFMFSPQERMVVHQRFEAELSRYGLSLQHLKLK
jgi:peptide/nickel transport system substrate-binding protein